MDGIENSIALSTNTMTKVDKPYKQGSICDKYFRKANNEKDQAMKLFGLNKEK